MSLIQEALEKASKPQGAEPFFEIPKRTPVQPPVSKLQTVKGKSVIPQAAGYRPAAPIQISPHFLIRAGAAAGLLLFFWAAAFLLGRAGKSSVMLGGISTAASESSMLPISDASSTPKFVLTGITDSADGKLALINNQVAGVGDRLQEKAFVKEIGARSVVLDYNHKEIKLTL